MSLTRETIITLGNKLVPAAATFSRLRILLLDPDADLQEIIKLIRLDQALTFHVVRLSNSVLFGFAEASTSLEESINRIGFREVYRLVGLAATNQLFPKELTLYAVRGDLVWENSLASALAMERLARSQGADDEQTAYTIGLLRSAGKVLFTRLAAQPGLRIAPYPGPEVEPHLGDWERGIFGMDSPEAAAELMEHWKFDATIRQAIRHQYDPLLSPEAPSEAALLNCAGWVVHQLGKSLPGEAAYWRRDPAKLEKAGILAEVVDGVVEEVRTELDVLKSAVSLG